MNTTTLALGRPGFFSGRTVFDWLFAVLVIAGGAFAFHRYESAMDGYEKAILVGAIPVAVTLGWFWGRLRVLMLAVGAAARPARSVSCAVARI